MQKLSNLWAVRFWSELRKWETMVEGEIMDAHVAADRDNSASDASADPDHERSASKMDIDAQHDLIAEVDFGSTTIELGDVLAAQQHLISTRGTCRIPRLPRSRFQSWTSLKRRSRL